MCIISCFLNACSIVLFYLWIQLWWERHYEVVWMKPSSLLGVLKVSVCLQFGIQTWAVCSTGNLDEKVEEFSASKWKVRFCFQTSWCMSQQSGGMTLGHCYSPVQIEPDPKALRSGVIPLIWHLDPLAVWSDPTPGGTGGRISTSSLLAQMMWQQAFGANYQY